MGCLTKMSSCHCQCNPVGSLSNTREWEYTIWYLCISSAGLQLQLPEGSHFLTNPYAIYTPPTPTAYILGLRGLRERPHAGRAGLVGCQFTVWVLSRTRDWDAAPLSIRTPPNIFEFQKIGTSGWLWKHAQCDTCPNRIAPIPIPKPTTSLHM